MKLLSFWHQSAKRQALCLTLCLVLFSSLAISGSLAVQAHSLSSSIQPPIGSRGKLIDWAHPLQVQPMMGHSGVGADQARNVIPLVLARPGARMQPLANFPSCYNNVAYYVGVGGVYSWSRTFKNYTAVVWYMWCQRFQGDAVGINWSQGHVNVSGCGHVEVGADQFYDGAMISDASNLQTHDGESATMYYVCNTYVWDDSLTVRGDGKYLVFMSGWLQDVSSGISIQSPCCY